ncbi:hypothetical protein [Actinoplanes sp. NPDC051851]|uniref:hypothetical protein n=1 Tax=Actinoplanes sp. NPDC051851 TaxID=3154753 RepID=UPI003420353C
MAGQLATFGRTTVQALQQIRAMTEVSSQLERNIHNVIGNIAQLRTQAAALTGSADRQLIKAMDKKLSQVRRRLESFRDHVEAGGDGSAYVMARDDLADRIADELELAEEYFHEVSRADPSPLRDSSRSTMINVRIDRGNDGSSRYAS